jgi:hypothetical protein
MKKLTFILAGELNMISLKFMGNIFSSKDDDLVKSLKRRISVIPAKAGIQYFKYLKILWTPVSTGVTTFYGVIKDKYKEE